MAKVKNVSGGQLELNIEDDDGNRYQGTVAADEIVTIQDKLFCDSDDISRLVSAGILEIIESTESGKERIFSTSDDLEFEALDESHNFSVSVNSTAQTIVMGRLYLPGDPGDSVDDTGKIELFHHSDRKGYQLISRNKSIKVVYEELSAAPSATDETIDVDDGSVYDADALVYIQGDNPEFARIKSIDTNELTLYDPLQYDHDIDDGVSQVMEVSSIDTMNSEGNEVILGKYTPSAAPGAVTFRLDLEVREQ